MLVLSRRPHEKIYFPSIGASLQILAIHGSTVRLGIEAPKEVLVLRAEVQDLHSSDRPEDSDSMLCADNS
jgi:carbon storage regulator